MKNKILLLLVIIFLLTIKINTKTVAIDTNQIMNHIIKLSSNNFEGRKSGLIGGSKAVDYITSKLKEYGILPGGPSNSYHQIFTIDFFNIKEGKVKVITSTFKTNLFLRKDFSILKYSGSIIYKGDVVFAGFGIKTDNYNDYEKVNIKGKIVLIANNFPNFVKDKENFSINKRIKYIQDKGGTGVIIAGKERVRIDKELYKSDFVIIKAKQRLIDFIFYDNIKKLNQLINEINKTKTPKSLQLNTTLEFNIKTEYDPNRKIKNIIAIIPGRDKKVKNEIVMFGAHYDHLGLTPDKEVFHGADDNASGTAVCLEVARLLRKLKPKRTIMISFWGAEEQGLYGSKYFIEHPYLNLNNIIGYFNLDMVGQGNGKINLMGTYYSEKIFEIIERNLNPEIKKLIIPRRGGPGGSDQTYFLLYGIPSFFLYTTGQHYNYHTIWDLPENISKIALRNTTKVLYESIFKISKVKYSLKENNRIERFLLKYADLTVSEPIEIDNLDKNLFFENFPIADLILTYSNFENYISLRDNLIYEVNRVNNYFNKELRIKFAENYTKLRTNINKSISSVYWGIRFQKFFTETKELPLFLKKIGVKYIYFKLNTLKVDNRIADFIDSLEKYNIASILINGSKAKINYLLNRTKSKGKSMLIYHSERVSLKYLLSLTKNYGLFLVLPWDNKSLTLIKPYLLDKNIRKRLGLKINIRTNSYSLFYIFKNFEYNKDNRDIIKGLLGNNLINFLKSINKDSYKPRRPF